MVSETNPRHSRENDAERKFKSNRQNTALLLGSFAFSTLLITTDYVASNIKTLSLNVESATTHSEQNDAASAIATSLAGESVRVDCNDDVLDQIDDLYLKVEHGRTFRTNGIVRPTSLPFDFGPSVITIREDACETITQYDPAPPDAEQNSPVYEKHAIDTWRFANSIGLVLHEIEHTQGVYNEAQAHCYAYQKLPAALEALGIDKAIAEGIAKTSAISQAEASMQSYLSDECRPGRAFDLDISAVYIGNEIT